MEQAPEFLTLEDVLEIHRAQVMIEIANRAMTKAQLARLLRELARV